MSAFFDAYGDAMRVGKPGPCKHGRSWHALDRGAVEEVRARAPGGGLVPCERCCKLIFVTPRGEAGIVVQGLPGVKLGGVEL